MTQQQERKIQAAFLHDEADAIKAAVRVIKTPVLREKLRAYAKFCRRMACNNERAYERNSH